MLDRVVLTLAFLLFFPHGCSDASTPSPVHLKYSAIGKEPEVLALYEAWFGQPNHISVGYSSNDPEVIKHQIDKAKSMGISAFVVDWYGNRDPLVDQSYGRMQALAAKHKFHVAMMYDEKSAEVGATDQAIAELTKFYTTYLAADSPGRDAYLTYEGRPVIFIFPSGDQTNWDQVRTAVNKWSPAPLLIQENLPEKYAADFDGFYPWPNPGPKGWAADGSNWGYDYLMHFYSTIITKYPDKIIVGGAWPQFDDSKASWGLNRHIAPRCGQTFWDTFGFWRQFVEPGQAIPFVLVETWNDYEEGTEIEPGIPTCDGKPAHKNLEKVEKKGTAPSIQPE
jgi:hypothetical protein